MTHSDFGVCWQHKSSVNRLPAQSDFPDGLPTLQSFPPSPMAVESWVKSGGLNKQMFSIDGIPCDGPNGEPAVRLWTIDGELRKQDHFQNGAYHNGPDGTPACQEWYPYSKILAVRYYLDGIRCNGPNGEPTNCEWHENGSMKLRYFCSEDGETSNGPNGEPARAKWNEDGSVSNRQFMVDGVLHDSPSGDPAFQAWGLGAEITHHINGRIISDTEAAWYRCNPEAFEAVTEHKLDHAVFMQALAECGGDLDAAVMLIRLAR